MKLLHDFKEFAMRGNVIDMAVGIIIGGAFGKIVSSFVNDVVMPPLGLLISNVDFSQLRIELGEREVGGQVQRTTLNYGAFLTNVLDFVILAFTIFVVIRWMNRLRQREESGEVPAPTTKPCPFCISTIPLQARRCPQCTSALE